MAVFNCDIEWLKPVEAHKPGDVQEGVAHDQMVEKWRRAGLLRVLRTDRTSPPSKNSSRETWLRFLRGVGLYVPSGATRAHMIREWKSHVQD